MAKNELTLPYTDEQLLALLNTCDNSPIRIYYDESGTQAMYRIFSVGPEEDPDARRKAWVEARDSDAMTSEIAAYELGNFQAPAPFSITLNFTSKEQVFVRDGDKNNFIEYSFITADSSGNKLNESVQVVYSFNNAGSTQSTVKIYNSGENVKMNIDQYLSVGTNTVTMTVTGRATGATRIAILHYHVVAMNLSSSFNVAVPRNPDEGLLVPFSLECSSAGAKTVEFYIDGSLADQIITTDTKIDSSASLAMPVSGKHHLQIRAFVEAGDGNFYSQTLYREFVVTGEKGIVISLALDLASGTLISADKKNLVLKAEQYVQSNIKWGFYNSNGKSATVKWSLGGENLRFTEANVTDAEANAEAYLLTFVPTNVGTLELKAEVGDSVTSYSLIVDVNASGISEATQGLKLKLQAVGRANNEPVDERRKWEFEKIQAVFPDDFAWSAQQGWYNYEALAVSGGKQVTVPFAPFANAPHTYGASFEIEFETYDVDDEDAVVVSVWGRNADGHECGVRITAEGCVFQNANGEQMTTRFKQGERIKLCFVVNRVESSTFPHLAMIYKDGVYERALDYGSGGSYTNNAHIILGDASGKAGIRIFNIRAYYQALNVNQELYNAWIDSGKIAQKIISNDIYENGIVSVEKMQGVIPVMLVDGLDSAYNNIATLEGVKDKTTKINVNVSFYNPFDITKNFTIKGARMKLQGTSSLGYPRKNFKLYSKKDAAVMYDFEGKVVNKGLYAFKDGGVPVSTWTLKADFMDSSCTRNASVARIFGDIEPNLNIKDASGNDAMKTPPQLAAQKYESKAGVKFPYALRTTPDGMAMVMFHKLPGDKQYTFLGQYTMLNDKGNEYVYGFHSIYVPTALATDAERTMILADPMCQVISKSQKKELLANGHIERIYDNEDTHCYEILDNINEFANFSTVEGWDTPINVDESDLRHCGWEAGFESRYPEIDDDDFTNEQDRLAEGVKQGAPLKAFIEWIMSCFVGSDAKGISLFSLDKFEAEMEDHLDLYKCAGYYMFLIRWGAVDQVKKNMMWTTYGSRSKIAAGESGYDNLIWFPIRYDNDSTADTRNDGLFFYNYKFLRQDLDPSTQGAYFYSGHDSLLWNALEQSERFMQIVVQVDMAFYASGLTYDTVIDYYDNKARNMWCESIYNENQFYKYIAPLLRADTSDKANYLAFLHGDDKAHQHWWFRNRFDMIDAKWGSGEFSNKYIHVLCPEAPTKNKIYVTASKSTNFGLVRNKVAVEQENGEFTIHCEKGEQVELIVKLSIDADNSKLAIGDPLYINGANNIAELDLHEFAPYFSKYLEFDKIYDKELGSNMKKLVLGISDEDLAKGVVNNGVIDTITGLDVMSRCEYLDMKGLANVTSFPFLKTMTGLKTLLLKGTGMASFECADGASFDFLQLPSGLRSVSLSRVNWAMLDYAPSFSLRYVNLDYMTDEKKFPAVKQFVFDWLDCLEAKYGMGAKWTDFTLKLTGIDWSGVEWHRLEQLMNLGSCVLSGHSYIMCATEYTSAQMTLLMAVFGNDIFTDGSDLIFDCDSENLVLGIEALKGTVLSAAPDGAIIMSETGSAQVVTTGFPIRGNDVEGQLHFGFQEASTKGVSIGSTSGKISSTEEGYAEHDLTIYAFNDVTNKRGYLTLRVRPLTYPQGVEIFQCYDVDGNLIEPDSLGNINITATGVYGFFSRFIPSGTTGSMKSFTWTYSGKDSSQSVENGRGTNWFALQVKSVEREVNETLVYHANFNNAAQDPSGIGVTSAPVKIAMFTIGDILVNNNFVGGNEALYAVIVPKYVPSPVAPNRVNSLELKSIMGSFVVPADSGLVNFRSTSYNILDHMKNVTSLSAAGCATLQEIEVGKMPMLYHLNLSGCVRLASVSVANNATIQSVDVSATSLNVGGTTDKPSLASLHLGSPSEIKIINCPKMNININDND